MTELLSQKQENPVTQLEKEIEATITQLFAAKDELKELQEQSNDLPGAVKYFFIGNQEYNIREMESTENGEPGAFEIESNNRNSVIQQLQKIADLIESIPALQQTIINLAQKIAFLELRDTQPEQAGSNLVWDKANITNMNTAQLNLIGFPEERIRKGYDSGFISHLIDDAREILGRKYLFNITAMTSKASDRSSEIELLFAFDPYVSITPEENSDNKIIYTVWTIKGENFDAKTIENRRIYNYEDYMREGCSCEIPMQDPDEKYILGVTYMSRKGARTVLAGCEMIQGKLPIANFAERNH
jgi:hypothetical protein